MGSSGGGGGDVKYVLAWCPPAPSTAPAPRSLEAGAPLAPFGMEPEVHDICIDALTERYEAVKKLIHSAQSLLDLAYDAFKRGAAVHSDRLGTRAVEDWIERLVCEGERLRLEIRDFGQAGAKLGAVEEERTG